MFYASDKPDGPPVFVNHTNGRNYTVIESVSQISTCIITGGNPQASLEWDCFSGTITSYTTLADTVVSNITWPGHRGRNGQCTCHSYHVAANETTSVNVNVWCKYI